MHAVVYMPDQFNQIVRYMEWNNLNLVLAPRTHQKNLLMFLDVQEQFPEQKAGMLLNTSIFLRASCPS